MSAKTAPSEMQLFHLARQAMASARSRSDDLDARIEAIKEQRAKLLEQRAEAHAEYMQWASFIDGSTPEPPKQPALPGLEG